MFSGKSTLKRDITKTRKFESTKGKERNDAKRMGWGEGMEGNDAKGRGQSEEIEDRNVRREEGFTHSAEGKEQSGRNRKINTIL